MVHIFSICSTYMVRSLLIIIRVYFCRVSDTMKRAFVQGIIIYKYVIQIPIIVLYVDN
jgi:hypothetical protein